MIHTVCNVLVCGKCQGAPVKVIPICPSPGAKNLTSLSCSQQIKYREGNAEEAGQLDSAAALGFNRHFKRAVQSAEPMVG